MSSDNLPLFTGKQLRALILPLIVEQFLGIFVGMADTMMVASAGEAAVSGVSLVDSLNVLLIVLLVALTTGGSVIISQHLGAKSYSDALKSAQQLLLSTTSLSLLMTAIALLGNYWLLHFIFGNIAPDVMGHARIYFFILAFSYPFLAIYNSCAAIFPCHGKLQNFHDGISRHEPFECLRKCSAGFLFSHGGFRSCHFFFDFPYVCRSLSASDAAPSRSIDHTENLFFAV